MSLNFPASPAVGQQSTQNGRTYEWSGYVWRIVGTIAGHAATHAANGSDALTLSANQISDFSTAVVAAAPPTVNASLLTSGTLADARLSGNVVLASNAALTNSRTPTAHASSHASGGSDALTLVSSQISDFATAAAAAAPATTNASLLTSGTLADARLTGNVVLTSDTRLNNSRSPTSHASSHASAGSDPLTLSVGQITGLGSLATANSVAYANLTGTPAAFAPSAHASSHASGGSDSLTLAASQITSGTLADARLSSNVVLTSNSALTNSRTPTAHASTHASGGSDALTLAANQVTSGTVATARLATGTANSSTYLRGDQTWATLAAITDTIFHPFLLGGM